MSSTIAEWVEDSPGTTTDDGFSKHIEGDKLVGFPIVMTGKMYCRLELRPSNNNNLKLSDIICFLISSPVSLVISLVLPKPKEDHFLVIKRDSKWGSCDQVIKIGCTDKQVEERVNSCLRYLRRNPYDQYHDHIATSTPALRGEYI